MLLSIQAGGSLRTEMNHFSSAHLLCSCPLAPSTLHSHSGLTGRCWIEPGPCGERPENLLGQMLHSARTVLSFICSRTHGPSSTEHLSLLHWEIGRWNNLETDLTIVSYSNTCQMVSAKRQVDGCLCSGEGARTVSLLIPPALHWTRRIGCILEGGGKKEHDY
jgi:hypothetical protein